MSVRSRTPDRGPLVRIGELSRRTSVGVDTLRAWERRYGLLRPQRSPGGFRLYGTSDEERVLTFRGDDLAFGLDQFALLRERYAQRNAA